MKKILRRKFIATAQAPSNIALIKYWGTADPTLILPNNDSISMCLADLHTTTTVEFSQDFSADEVAIGFFPQPVKKVTGVAEQKVMAQLNRIRKLAGTNMKAHVSSINNFPASVGIASSASGFAALTHAACASLNLNLSTKELSMLTRLSGSGSATRSIPDGFVIWHKGTAHHNSFAESIIGTDEWDLADVIVVVSTKVKDVSSVDGHRLATTSPFYQARLAELPARTAAMKQAILDHDLNTLGRELENETVSFYCTTLSSQPSIWYWTTHTLDVIEELKKMQVAGTKAFFTTDAGPNVHLICEARDSKKIAAHFKKFPGVQMVFTSRVGKGSRIVAQDVVR